VAGIYVHVPFCSQRCVYCDFYFVTTKREGASFVRSLEAEAAWYASEFGTREPVETIYVGGGTPSLLSLAEVERVLTAIHRGFDTAGVREVTFEANPEDVAGEAGAAYLAGLRGLGVTRLSLGVQSYFDEDLRFFTRVHDAAVAEDATRRVAEAGFDSFSVDLIFGRPEQPFEYWAANLQKAVRLGAPHVSTYGLTIEERTPLARQVELGRVVPAGDETMRERYAFTAEYLASEGLEHYEVSSFARPGHRSQHNESYWRHGNYLGLGPSAHSFWRRTRSRGERWSNVRHLGQWQGLLDTRALPVDARETVDADTLADEAILLGLRRLADGLDLEDLERDYGVDLLAERSAVLAELERAGLIHPVTDRVRLTTEGAAVADAVALRLVG
jgi:oxygen-independent coproporphyrinogen-3 oxidase